MKYKEVRIAINDDKAWEWINENLSIRSDCHTLSRKLLERYSHPCGRIVAFVPDWLEISELSAYRYSTLPPSDTPTSFEPGEGPRDRLIQFVEQYLCSSSVAVAVCENSGEIRKHIAFWQWGALPPMLFYGQEEIYHVLQLPQTSHEVIDTAVSDSMGQWGTGVCSVCSDVPQGTLSDDLFLDEIANNTKHVFLPAFDGDGYLIWSPRTGNE